MLTLQISVFAQNKIPLKLTGKVIEAQAGTSLGFATVQLFKQNDTIAVASATTSEEGDFILEAPQGTYYATIAFVGYNTYKSSVFKLTPGNAPFDLGTIKLNSLTKTLDEIVVQGEKSSMQLSLDKKIFNVGKDLANAGGTAVDILSNIPSVAVDVEGNVSLRGSNSVRILIDGKPSGLVSLRGGSGLQQLQGSMIERIEIITNPSAR